MCSRVLYGGVAVALVILLLFTFGGDSQSVYASKPTIFKEWKNAELDDMEQLGDALYVSMWDDGEKVIKIDLHTFSWKTISFIKSVSSVTAVSFLKCNNSIYYLVDPTRGVPAIYKIEQNDSVVRENIYYPPGAYVTSEWSTNPGVVFLRAVHYVHGNLTAWFGAYDLQTHKERSFNLTNPHIWMFRYGDEDNVYFVNLINRPKGGYKIIYKMVAYDYNGTVRWTFTTEPILLLVGSDGNYVYAMSMNYSLLAINKYTGKIAWAFSKNIEDTNMIAMSSDALYVVGSGNRPMWKISKNDGKVMWKQNITADTRIIKFGDYVVAYSHSEVYFINDATGEIEWKITRKDLGKAMRDWEITRVTMSGNTLCVYMGKRASVNEYLNDTLFVLGWLNERGVAMVVYSSLLVMTVVGGVAWRKEGD
ncbi:MAG: PQQ-binding-like beta-propeller repeat protein [Euryarchaeota archaeon]|nr:PQQ-binding-like beta-propeller repeat protein [Euryarchaeota archaeon]